MELMRGIWDRQWQGKVDTLTEKDILFMLDEIKLEYTLLFIETIQGKVNTLEVGSGSGRLSCFLASKGYETTCLDYSPNALRVAVNNYRLSKNKGIFVMGDAESLPFKNGSFEVVLSTGLLEHFPDPQLVVNEMARVLKPGGCFISDIVPEKLWSLYMSEEHISRIIKSIKPWIKGVRQERIYEGRLSKRDIKRCLQSADLFDINIIAAGVVPPPLDFLPRIPFGKRIWCTYNTLSYRLKPFFKRLDNTVLAELFGLYYFAHAKKPSSEGASTLNVCKY